MSLLPKSSGEFQLKEYWDKFFTKRSSTFEWYGEYTDLCHVLHKYLKTSNKILMVGCGNSKLSADLYDVGFHFIENIDISDVVIRQMSAKHKEKRPEMNFTKMDMLNMTYSNNSFDCVLDKGTLDAIFSNKDDVTVSKVEGMFREIERVLKTSGRYVCVTLAQEHILEKLLKRFESHWLLRVHHVLLGTETSEESGVGGALPVFVFVMTKMMRIEGRPPLKVYEYVTSEGGECVRCEGVEGIANFVKDNQQYAIVSHHLSSLHPNEPAITLDLWTPSVTTEPRYTLAVTDIPKAKTKSGPFAVFIAPQGRETDWLFSCDYGRSQLADSAGFERLVIVTLHRAHTYSSLDAVKEEVAGKAVELVQSGLTQRKQYPVLTLGDGLGSRVVLYEGCSVHSGGYVVEECEGGEGGGRMRRLVFLDTPHLAQTEIKMVTGKSSKSKKSKKTQPSHSSPLKLDHTHLSCDHHKVIVATLALVPDLFSTGKETKKEMRKIDILLIGLGGGALPMFIDTMIENVCVDIVELDLDVLTVAEKWFGFSQDDQRKVHIADGVKFVQDCLSAGKKGCYDVVIFDVDSKDISVGMSSPPSSFVTSEFLTDTKTLLRENGMFITNLASRNQDIKGHVLLTINQVFPQMWTLAVPEDINEIVIGMPAGSKLPFQNSQDVTSLKGTKTLEKELTNTSLCECVRENIVCLAKIASERSRGVRTGKELVEEWTDILKGVLQYSNLSTV